MCSCRQPEGKFTLRCGSHATSQGGKRESNTAKPAGPGTGVVPAQGAILTAG